MFCRPTSPSRETSFPSPLEKQSPHEIIWSQREGSAPLSSPPPLSPRRVTVLPTSLSSPPLSPRNGFLVSSPSRTIPQQDSPSSPPLSPRPHLTSSSDKRPLPMVPVSLRSSPILSSSSDRRPLPTPPMSHNGTTPVRSPPLRQRSVTAGPRSAEPLDPSSLSSSPQLPIHPRATLKRTNTDFTYQLNGLLAKKDSPIPISPSIPISRKHLSYGKSALSFSDSISTTRASIEPSSSIGPVKPERLQRSWSMRQQRRSCSQFPTSQQSFSSSSSSSSSQVTVQSEDTFFVGKAKKHLENDSTLSMLIGSLEGRTKIRDCLYLIYYCHLFSAKEVLHYLNKVLKFATLEVKSMSNVGKTGTKAFTDLQQFHTNVSTQLNEFSKRDQGIKYKTMETFLDHLFEDDVGELNRLFDRYLSVDVEHLNPDQIESRSLVSKFSNVLNELILTEESFIRPLSIFVNREYARTGDSERMITFFDAIQDEMKLKREYVKQLNSLFFAAVEKGELMLQQLKKVKELTSGIAQEDRISIGEGLSLLTTIPPEFIFDRINSLIRIVRLTPFLENIIAKLDPKRLRKHPVLIQFYDRSNGKNASDITITATQRIARYPLLLNQMEEILKKLGLGHATEVIAERKACFEALASFTNFLSGI